MYGAMEESTPAEAPALGPAELKAVRKLLATNGDDARSTGLSQASSASTLPTLATQALSASTLAKLEAASDEVEFQQSIWDASLFLFNPVAGRGASLFAFLLLCAAETWISSTRRTPWARCGGPVPKSRVIAASLRMGDKSMSAEEIRTILSPPPPLESCAAASTGACLEGGGVDDDCCAQCGEGGCAPGYTYTGQIAFDEETRSSAFPDFNPFCSALLCGNTCCVPSDE